MKIGPPTFPRVLFTLLLKIHLANAAEFSRTRRACARALLTPASPMAAESRRIRSRVQTARFLLEAKLNDFIVNADLKNVRKIVDHQGRTARVAEIGGKTFFLKSYYPGIEMTKVRGNRVCMVRREAVFLKILDDLR